MRVYPSAKERRKKKNKSTFHSELIMHFPHQIVSVYSITSLITSVFFSHNLKPLPAAVSSIASDTLLPQIGKVLWKASPPRTGLGLLGEHSSALEGSSSPSAALLEHRNPPGIEVSPPQGSRSCF